MQHEVDRRPVRAQLFERRIQRGVVAYVQIEQDVRADARRERFDPSREILALIGKRKLGTRRMQRLRHTPRD